jgi:transcriptional regulator with XRE-family HTH domain
MGVAPPPSRRGELGAFLRSRRARLTPADVGLSDNGSRRRTPGLRREEVAVLARVGVSWYTWLEQGRDINASPQVLDALAGALRLSAAERDTLYALARGELPLPDGTPIPGDDDDLVALVEALHPNPAYLHGPLTRILAFNGATEIVLGGFAHLPFEQRTLLYRWFVDLPPERRTSSWEEVGRSIVARFRAEHARHAGEPEYEEQISMLREHSAEFAAWWDGHDIADAQRGAKTIEHPELGILRFYHAQTIPTGAPELRLTVYAPADDATRAILATL